jgi:hypothetical protein
MEMAQITIAYLIMIPVFIVQIIVFPYVTSILMNICVDSRRTIAIEEAANHLSSSMEQLYFSVNHDTIAAGKVTYTLDLPRYIEDYYYTGNATLQTGSADPNGSRILGITLKYVGAGISTSVLAIFGGNMEWKNSSFQSNSKSACITAEKQSNGTILMYFG